MRRASGELRLSRGRLAVVHVTIACLVFFAWWLLTETKVLAPFFFGEPLKVVRVIYEWFVTGKIWPHLAITLWETVLAFIAGSVLGLSVGLWPALGPRPGAAEVEWRWPVGHTRELAALLRELGR